MCGLSARTTRTSSSALRERSSRRSAGPILSAYVASPAWGVKRGAGSLRTPSRRPAATSAAFAKTVPASSSGSIEKAFLRRHGPGVELGDGLVDRDAGLLVAGHDRALHRRRPAPAWEKRRMHVQPRALREQRLGDEQAVGADDDGRRVELEPLEPGARAGGRGSRAARRRPSPEARVTFRPRPAAASGRVRSAATSCRCASRSSTSAPNGAVAATAMRAMRTTPERAAGAAA